MDSSSDFQKAPPRLSLAALAADALRIDPGMPAPHDGFGAGSQPQFEAGRGSGKVGRLAHGRVTHTHSGGTRPPRPPEQSVLRPCSGRGGTLPPQCVYGEKETGKSTRPCAFCGEGQARSAERGQANYFMQRRYCGEITCPCSAILPRRTSQRGPPCHRRRRGGQGAAYRLHPARRATSRMGRQHPTPPL